MASKKVGVIGFRYLILLVPRYYGLAGGRFEFDQAHAVGELGVISGQPNLVVGPGGIEQFKQARLAFLVGDLSDAANTCRLVGQVLAVAPHLGQAHDVTAKCFLHFDEGIEFCLAECRRVGRERRLGVCDGALIAVEEWERDREAPAESVEAIRAFVLDEDVQVLSPPSLGKEELAARGLNARPRSGHIGSRQGLLFESSKLQFDGGRCECSSQRDRWNLCWRSWIEPLADEPHEVGERLLAGEPGSSHSSDQLLSFEFDLEQIDLGRVASLNPYL